MKEIIYLAVSRRKVERMTKRLPDLDRGEIPVKLEIVVEDSAFREPVLSQRVIISDWREGIDIADVELREQFITEAEAEMIRQKRLTEMRSILEGHGFTVTASAAEAGDGS